MKRLTLGMVVRYNGKLAEVTGIADGRTIHLSFSGEKDCSTCGKPAGVALLEHAPLLQEHLEPVATVEGHNEDTSPPPPQSTSGSSGL